ncbi:type II toxin-antitoxin system VapC family toxin [Cronbergia sp. UHCC 0137]|uniref:type II toxin-antitoxin system VapC family toxin n=1 Tax=Cronbergia sp. UHCC 0137 TaxID=3110239 RepID=UPI002B1F4147|nr:type II toxin-antitoxin system VapC family toxin [Cronbergia sp. UHCC 0137]MEA5620081.1 type II toxin-antitoxin system VapC family toxin [Cronbergia sp. UHCC 0137]
MDVTNKRYVIDTNVTLYLLGGRLLNTLPVGEFYLSVISEIEMLSYPAISAEEELKIQHFLSQVIVVGLDKDLKNAVIKLRKQYRLKLPDAIICATALIYDAVLLSNDLQLASVAEISVDTVQIQ